MATLVLRHGTPTERAYPLASAPTTIGRAPDQTICIPHTSLSRSHARVEPAGDGFAIVDLKSTNGTVLNGARVDRATLRDGDLVKLGDVTLTFRSPPPPEPPTALKLQATCGLTQVVPSFGWRPEAREAAMRARDRLRVLIEMGKVLPVYDDVNDLLRKVLELVFQIADVDRGAILLVDEATGRLEQRVTKTASAAPGGAAPIFSQRIVDYVMRERVAAVFADARSDPRLDLAGSLIAQSIHAAMCAPLQPRDQVIGVLYVDNQRAPQAFTADDLELFAAFAGQAAVALENAALYRQLERETVARMQMVMEEKLSALGALLGRIAHELRNPINLMINFGEASRGQAAELADALSSSGALPQGEPGDEAAALLEDLRTSTERLSQHGRRASAILEAMLQRTRPGSTEREASDLNALVARSARAACSASAGRGFEVRLVERYAHGLGTLHAAPAELGRVFSAVAENAVTALRDRSLARPSSSYRPELTVTTAALRAGLEVRFRDNGVGVAQAMLGRMFEPFVTTRPAGEGAGLGLWLARETVVAGYQGTITAESALGEWTEVVVTLPRAPA